MNTLFQWPNDRRQIPPGAAGSGDPQHGLDKQPVVLPTAAGIARLAKTKRLHLRPLGVSQNESVHPKLESQPSPDENPKSQQTLDRRSRRFVFREISGLFLGTDRCHAPGKPGGYTGRKSSDERLVRW